MNRLRFLAAYFAAWIPAAALYSFLIYRATPVRVRSVSGATIGGEGAVRPLGEHAYAGPDALQAGGVVAEVLHRDAKAIVPRRGRQRERMRLKPSRRCHEPPQEELSGLRVDEVEIATAYLDRHDTRRLAFHRMNAEVVAKIQTPRLDHAPPEHRSERGEVEDDPPRACRTVAAEVGADGELVRERERDREVRVEMDEVPRLTLQLASGDLDGRHTHRDEHREADPGHEDVGIVRHEIARLGPQRNVITLRGSIAKAYRRYQILHLTLWRSRTRLTGMSLNEMSQLTNRLHIKLPGAVGARSSQTMRDISSSCPSTA